MTFTFSLIEPDDLSLLSAWLRQPHVQRWWREDPSAEAVLAAYGPLVDGSDPTEGCIAHLDGEAIGYIQRYRLDDNPAWQVALAASVGPEDAAGSSAGIDYLIGDATLTGRGIGTRMIDAFVAETWARYADAPAVVVDVDQENIASWRCLERLGFSRLWAGELDSDDPSDEGPCFVYRLARPHA